MRGYNFSRKPQSSIVLDHVLTRFDPINGKINHENRRSGDLSRRRDPRVTHLNLRDPIFSKAIQPKIKTSFPEKNINNKKK